MATIHAFGPFRLDAEAEILFRGAEPLPVGKRAVALLRVLVERPGAPVSKDALIEAAWAGLAVEESNLPVQISALRRVLGEEPGGERWIETLPRRGYRFVGPIMVAKTENSGVIERQTPPAAQDSAIPQPEALATPPQQSEPGRRQLSIVSCELVWAGRDLEDRREAVSAYQSCVARVVGTFQGFIGKHVANTILVYFGYPVAHENDAELAVRAGLAVCAAVSTLKVNAETPLFCRTGIATGQVIFGDLIGDTAERGLIGEVPNVAVRLQMSAQPSAVVIDDATRHLIGRLFDFREVGAIEVEGGDPICAWRVLGISSVDSRFEALHAPPLAPFVGRDEELELVLRRWAEVKRGQGRFVVLTGEPGIGKSRLMRAFQERLGAEPHSELIYHCSPYYQDSALHPFISQLAHAAGIEHEDTSDAKLDKLATLLMQSSEPIDRDMALIAALLSIPGGDRFPLPNQTPRQLKERTLGALAAWLRRLCSFQPVLMLLEDLHWIDPTSLELLTRVVEQAHGMRLLLLATARPEFEAPWPNHRHIMNVALSRLDCSEGQALVKSISHHKALPLQVLDQIVARADGVPLFIEELTKTVLESGLLRDTANGYELTGPLPTLAIPSTLHASLLARLDRLATAVKGVAQVGAAIGREFPYSIVAAVAALTEADLLAALSQLVHTGLIFERGAPPEATYVFKHALVQGTAYATLIRSQRRQLHARIANELTSRREIGENVNAAMLGYHCSEAGMSAQAVTYYREGAEESVARSALSEAAELLSKALGELNRLPHSIERDQQELEFQCALGAVLMPVRGYGDNETGKTYDRAKELWDRLGRPSDFLKVPWGQWLFHLARSELRESQAIAEDLIQFSHPRCDTGGLILGNHAVGVTYFHRGELLSARPKMEEAIRIYDTAIHSDLFKQAGTDPNLMARSYLGLTLLWLGYPDRGLARMVEAIREARQSMHAPTMAQCLAMGARLAMILGDKSRCTKWVEELSVLTNEHGYPSWSAQVRMYEGQFRLWRGEAKSAVTLVRQSLDIHLASGSTLRTSLFVSLLSEALALDGQSDESLSLLDDQIATVAKTGELWFAAELHRCRGQLLLKGAVPNFVAAQAEYVQALDIARSQSAKLWELRAAVSLARMWRDEGRNTDARRLLSPIFSWFTEGFDTAELKNAKKVLDELIAI